MKKQQLALKIQLWFLALPDAGNKESRYNSFGKTKKTRITAAAVAIGHDGKAAK